MDIHRNETPSGGRYWIDHEGGAQSELTYSLADEHLMIIDHTGVHDSQRGGGVGVALVRQAVEDARLEARKILPLCPFAAAQFRRHSEWRDVLSDNARKR